MRGQYAPSFLAGYRSACELLTGLRTQFSLFPPQMARFWVLWTHAFSSSVSDSILVIEFGRSLTFECLVDRSCCHLSSHIARSQRLHQQP
jgi:hypothetical protein